MSWIGAQDGHLRAQSPRGSLTTEVFQIGATEGSADNWQTTRNSKSGEHTPPRDFGK